MTALTPPTARPNRPPVPALIATALTALYAGSSAYNGAMNVYHHDWQAIIGSVVSLGLWCTLLAGLWVGNRAAYIVAIIAAILTTLAGFLTLGTRWQDVAQTVGLLVVGVSMLLLLLAFRSSRAYYSRRPAA